MELNLVSANKDSSRRGKEKVECLVIVYPNGNKNA